MDPPKCPLCRTSTLSPAAFCHFCGTPTIKTALARWGLWGRALPFSLCSTLALFGAYTALGSHDRFQLFNGWTLPGGLLLYVMGLLFLHLLARAGGSR